MANPGRRVPITLAGGYGVVMAEPGNTDLLAAIQALAATVEALQESVADGFTRQHAEFVETRREVNRLREDLLGIKVDVAAADRHIGDFQTWARRHEADPGAHAA